MGCFGIEIPTIDSAPVAGDIIAIAVGKRAVVPRERIVLVETIVGLIVGIVGSRPILETGLLDHIGFNAGIISFAILAGDQIKFVNIGARFWDVYLILPR